MKRIHYFLFAVIFFAIAGKANLNLDRDMGYAALSTDTKTENVDQFFKYKVNHLQFDEPQKIRSCSIKSAICSHA
ncbi:hypothetical protein [Christiangramia sediminis]|uniref:Uncharacterized protein n=1 Tax=Christiangramia sediminis TaxID=2881336 RepID=A0A9X1LG40_9FLAO|nr:hypothetical protein [Christiangramia sediminis]MCB7479728.1 hypothetical protein [Christiangramia sediminis]